MCECSINSYCVDIECWDACNVYQITDCTQRPMMARLNEMSKGKRKEKKRASNTEANLLPGMKSSEACDEYISWI